MKNEELANTPVSSFCLLPSAFVSAGHRAAWQAVPDCRRNKPRGGRGGRKISRRKISLPCRRLEKRGGGGVKTDFTGVCRPQTFRLLAAHTRGANSHLEKRRRKSAVPLGRTADDFRNETY